VYSGFADGVRSQGQELAIAGGYFAVGHKKSYFGRVHIHEQPDDKQRDSRKQRRFVRGYRSRFSIGQLSLKFYGAGFFFLVKNISQRSRSRPHLRLASIRPGLRTRSQHQHRDCGIEEVKGTAREGGRAVHHHEARRPRGEEL